MFYVVGSGPSGIAAATALLDEGRSVTMLDVGETCEPDRITAARRLAATPRDEWSPADLETVRGSSYFEDPERPLKRAYGSTFAYALDEMRGDAQQGTRCVQSFARGGLSNVWGAAVLPARARDRQDWPIAADALDHGYAAVAHSMPIAGADDDLASAFPFYAAPQPPLRSSRQALALIGRLSAHRAALCEEGITFGRSRLAVRTVPVEGSSGCQYTGLCLTGCPYSAIWTAGDALNALQARSGFTYRSGFHVASVHPNASQRSVTITGTASNGRHESITAARALLACGPLATARIVLHSLRHYDRPIGLRYQPYFLLPMLASRSVKGVESEALHTLAQVFVEIENPAVSPFTVHLQIYTYNSFIGERLRAATRFLGPFGRGARDRLAGRLMAVQGYLHSDVADSIALTARLDAARNRAGLELKAGRVPLKAIRRAIAMLMRHRRRFGAMPLRPMLRIGWPGDGNHCGGSFPMRERPGPLETDLDGQLPELPGVHLVDSSVLPSLPATTFTYTVMANADRIARAVARSGPALSERSDYGEPKGTS